nr:MULTISPECIES: hypothetical protein [unclassified Bradyrhizobium]
MTPPDELDADGKAVFGEASANYRGGLSRLIEHGGVCRDVQGLSFVRGGLIRRKTHDGSRGCDNQIEWKRPLDHSGFCAFQFVARFQQLPGIDLRAAGDQSVKRRMDSLALLSGEMGHFVEGARAEHCFERSGEIKVEQRSDWTNFSKAASPLQMPPTQLWPW